MLHTELSKQEILIEESEKYQLERKQIIEDNRNLNKKVNKIESEFEIKNEDLEKQFKNKVKDLEFEYRYKIKRLEKENRKLNKIIDRFYDTVEKFIAWICKKFGIGEQKELVRKFKKDNVILLNPEKQLKREEKEKSWDLEI